MRILHCHWTRIEKYRRACNICRTKYFYQKRDSSKRKKVLSDRAPNSDDKVLKYQLCDMSSFFKVQLLLSQKPQTVSFFLRSGLIFVLSVALFNSRGKCKITKRLNDSGTPRLFSQECISDCSIQS